jgi:hypothetical protein
VHHVDECKSNNAPSNLVACQDTAYHFLLHVRTRTVRAGGDPNTQRVCGRCKRVLLLSLFHISRADQATGRVTICKNCIKVRQHEKTTSRFSETS